MPQLFHVFTIAGVHHLILNDEAVGTISEGYEEVVRGALRQLQDEDWSTPPKPLMGVLSTPHPIANPNATTPVRTPAPRKAGPLPALLGGEILRGLRAAVVKVYMDLAPGDATTREVGAILGITGYRPLYQCTRQLNEHNVLEYKGRRNREQLWVVREKLVTDPDWKRQVDAAYQRWIVDGRKEEA